MLQVFPEKMTFSGPDEHPMCEKCQITFSKRCTLYRHMRKFHPEQEIMIKGNQTCGICRGRFRTMTLFHSHLESDHSVRLKFINKTFYSENDLMAWKMQIEREEQSLFTFRNGADNKNTGVKLMYYVCNRSGFFRPKINRKRSLKVAGSVKMGYTCPAIIKVYTQTVDEISEIKVQYQSVHVGHGFEASKLPLSKEERTNLASCLNLGIPMRRILGDIRKKYPPTKRIGLIKRQDLYNVCRDFSGGKKLTLHQEDAKSVDLLVKEMQSDKYNPVLIYKPVGDLLLDYPNIGKDEILLGIMNETQEKLLELYGNDCIMIDFIRGANEYGFEFTTVLVHDDKLKGLPVATLFASRTSEIELFLFFTEIKKRLPNLKTNALMSDDTNLFYDAWQATFKDESKHLLCSWLVDKDWISNINTKVKYSENRENIKADLRNILTELDIVTFEWHMDKFIESYENVEQDFINYFKMYYKDRAEKWAYCYRVCYGINTNIQLQQWCQLQKKDTGGRVIKRLDKAIGVVTNAIAKQLLSRINLLERGKLTSTVGLIWKLHKVSVKMTENYSLMELDNKYIITKTEGSSSFTYNVEKTNETCECQIRCDECSVCIHSFSCTCVDYCIRFLICEHIHYVCQKSESPTPSVGVLHDVKDIIMDVNVYNTKQMFEKDAVVQTLLYQPSDADIEKGKAVLNKLQDLQRRIQGLNSDELTYLEENIDAITEYLDISAACSSHPAYLKTSDIL